MKHIAATLFSAILLLMPAGCQNDIDGECGQPTVIYNCDLKIYVVDRQGANLIPSGDYDPNLFRWQVKYSDGRYHMVSYQVQDPYLYTVEKDEEGERGEYILTSLYDWYRHDPTERRVDENNRNIEYWTTDIVLDYNYFDSSERADTLRSIIRYERSSGCPHYIYSLQELHINGRPVWQEGITAGAPEWTVVR